ncbi:MAG: carboxylesterase/lipase family protein [Pseudomonadales bacterium]
MKKLTIGLIVISLAVVGYFTLTPGEPPPPAPVEQDDVTLRSTTAGDVVGFIDSHGARAWKGIPFAEPPVDGLRWRAPQPPLRWSGVKKTLAASDICPQLKSQLSGRSGAADSDVAGTEDCLYLNVFSPVNAADLPVMFWIHGGGNTIGDGGSYNGAALATKQNVVVITINYRLGPIGWFAHPDLARGNPLDDSGNYGTLDVVRALEWTRNNISEFGGDPTNVTVFGESAGAFDTLAMMASPLASGLFHRAIVQSGGFSPTSMEQARNHSSEGGHAFSAREIVSHLLVTDGTVADLESARSYQSDMGTTKLREYLYGKSIEEIFAPFVGNGFGGMINVPDNFGDGHVLPDMTTEEIFSSAENHNRVPVILGTNRDEPALFMAMSPENLDTFLWIFPRLKDEDRYLRSVKYGALAWKVRGVDSLAGYMTAAGNPDVYAYRFDWDEEGSVMGYDLSKAFGAAHAMEIAFVFGDFENGLAALGDLYTSSPNRDVLSDSMMSYWTQFAITGNPGTGRDSQEVPWLSWGTNGQRSIILDTPDDRGIRMMSEEVSMAGIKAQLAADPEIADARERCQLYMASFGRIGFNEEEYNDFGPDGCAQFDPGEFSRF